MKKVVSLFIVLSLLISGFSFAYDPANDVRVDMWSFDYISFVSEKEFIPVYEGNDFRPLENVSKIDFLIASFKVLEDLNLVSSTENVNNLVLYQKKIMELGFASYYEKYGDIYTPLAYALANELVTELELSNFLDDNYEYTLITKEESLGLLGKYMNHFLETELSQFALLEYTDIDDIAVEFIPYINFLIEQDVIGPYGDGTGKLNPKLSVSREVFAFLINNLYESLSSLENVVEVIEEEVIESSRSFDAEVSFYIEDQDLLEIRSNEGIEVYNIEDTDVFVENVLTPKSKLITGSTIEVSIEENEVIRIDLEKEYNQVTGELTDVINIDNIESGVNVLEVSRDGKSFLYRAFETTLFYKNGEISEFSDLSEGDVVTIEYDGLYAIKVHSYEETFVVSGIVVHEMEPKIGNIVSVKMDDDTYFDYTFNINWSGILEKNEIVELRMGYNELMSIDHSGFKSEETGQLVEILIGAESRIKLSVGDKVNTYPLNKNIVIKKNDEISIDGIYTLRYLDQVTVMSDGLSITEIIVNNTTTVNEEKEKVEGTIVEIFSASNLMKVKDDNDFVWVVIILDPSQVNIADYKIGDRIYVYGNKVSEDIIEAELLLNVN